MLPFRSTRMPPLSELIGPMIAESISERRAFSLPARRVCSTSFCRSCTCPLQRGAVGLPAADEVLGEVVHPAVVNFAVRSHADAFFAEADAVAP